MEERPAMNNLPASPPDAADRDQPSADGILQCLRMLADEAASLQLCATLDALRTAMAVCAAESDPLTADMGAPQGALLH